MSEVAKVSGENQESPVQVTIPETVGAAVAATEASAVAEPSTEEQVVNNSDGKAVAAAGSTGDTDIPVDEIPESAEDSSPKVENKKTPAKRTPSKRMSFIERAQKESEELVKNMGGSLELEGGRRTRSSTRGTPTRAAAVSTPPPAKKARASPANTGATPSRGRGRGRKIDTSATEIEPTDTENKKEEQVETGIPTKTVNVEDVAAKLENDADEIETEISDKKCDTASNNSEKFKEPKEKPTADSVDTNDSKEKSDLVVIEKSTVVPEEKQNNIDHPVEEVQKEEEEEELQQEDSPLETIVEDKTAANIAEVPVVTATKVVNAEASAPLPESSTDDVGNKSSTPEPMEVDSNSRSSDAIKESGAIAITEQSASTSVATLVEAMETDNSTEEPDSNPTQVPVSASTELEATSNTALSQAAENEKETTNDAASDSPAIVTEEKNSVVELTAVPATEIVTLVDEQSASVVKTTSSVENAVVETTAAGEPIATTAVVAPAENNENNKSETDLCEPKIASPSINTNNDSAVSTPQFCN